jgi:hypothetical protein
MNQYIAFLRDRLFGQGCNLTSAQDMPTFPARKGTVIAAVLAELLKGRMLNCISTAQEMQTSRLKDQIASLRKRYGWRSICSNSIAIHTKDGRVQWVSQYWLPITAPDRIDTAEIGTWIKAVEFERDLKRRRIRSDRQKAGACKVSNTSPAAMRKGKNS